MSAINTEIREELRRLVENCTVKRELLLNSALSKSNFKKNLTITSGALALLSAGTITTVIIKYLGNEILQLIAALSAGISGIISIVVTAYYGDDDTSKIFEGSSKYLALRDKAFRFLIHPSFSNEQIFNELASLQTEYSQLDNAYSKFIPQDYHKGKLFGLKTRQENSFQYQRGPLVNVPSKYIKVKKIVQKEMDKFDDEASSYNSNK